MNYQGTKGFQFSLHCGPGVGIGGTCHRSPPLIVPVLPSWQAQGLAFLLCYFLVAFEWILKTWWLTPACFHIPSIFHHQEPEVCLAACWSPWKFSEDGFPTCPSPAAERRWGYGVSAKRRPSADTAGCGMGGHEGIQPCLPDPALRDAARRHCALVPGAQSCPLSWPEMGRIHH